MKLFVYYLTRIFFLFSATLVVAQNNYTSQILIDPQVEKSNNSVMLHMNVNLNKLTLNSRQMLVLTPVIESVDETQRKELTPIIINGRNRDKAIDRALALQDAPVFNQDIYTMVRRHNGKNESVQYQVEVPYESWMGKSNLLIREDVIGCAENELSEYYRMVQSPFLNEVYNPSYQISYITPKVEEVKRRNEVHEVRLQYKVGSSVVLPDFDGNASELNKVASDIRMVNEDPDLDLTGIRITGYASPEGSFASNMKLSEARARSLAAYLQKTYGVNNDMFSLDWKEEDWEGLAKAVEGSSVANRAQVLDIIRRYETDVEREKYIQAINGGRTYQTLLRELYPPLRRNTCEIEFNVKQFDLDKAKTVIRTNPKLLSLNEMYLVANSYPKGSAEYKEAMDVAMRMYPDSPEAINNMTAGYIESGDYATALSRMDSVKNQPEVWNNMGIALAQSGRYEEAADYFNRAARNGVQEAQENSRQLQRFMESQ
ncbi:MAG: DUF3868 domain-containing protein [Tannerellaceae bacterium]|nr:DUF3868 domain-containing protein [Tannerellaceae bacterium]